jgi:hypothetical protein
MHRDHWIPADDRTQVSRLFACSLTPQVSHLTPAPGCSLTPQVSHLTPAPGCLVLARRAALLCRCAKATGVRPPPNTLKSPEGDKWCKWSVVSGCSLTPIASSPSPASGCLISIESLVGSEGQHTQKGACLGRSSECTLPLAAGGRRASDRLAKLRDGSIGSLALGHPFGPNLVSFRGREARHR